MRRLHPALLLLPLAACTVDFPLQSAWVTDDDVLLDGTDRRQDELTVTSGMRPLHVTLEVDAGAGTAAFAVVDPAGTVRWQAQIDGPSRLRQECTLPAEPGRWQVRREWQGFHGSLHFAVAASSPERVRVQVAPTDR